MKLLAGSIRIEKIYGEEKTILDAEKTVPFGEKIVGHKIVMINKPLAGMIDLDDVAPIPFVSEYAVDFSANPSSNAIVSLKHLWDYSVQAYHHTYIYCGFLLHKEKFSKLNEQETEELIITSEQLVKDCFLEQKLTGTLEREGSVKAVISGMGKKFLGLVDADIEYPGVAILVRLRLDPR